MSDLPLSYEEGFSPAPEDSFFHGDTPDAERLIIACGALAREMLVLIQQNKWVKTRLHCLPAILHNYPADIPDRLRALIRSQRRPGEQVIVVYSDCGTGGGIARVAKEEGADYIGGAHCYQVFAGDRCFEDLMVQSVGSFFLTDFLVRHFDVFVTKSLGLDRFPQLKSIYFGHYTKLVYLAQTDNPLWQQKAKEAAEGLGLDYHYVFTGFGGYETYLASLHKQAQGGT